MAGALARAAAVLGWAVLGLAAALGVGLAAISFLATATFSRAFVAERVVKVLDDAIAGHVTLDAVEVLPHGGIELRGFQVTDPEGHLVLSVGRARAQLDLTGLRGRAVGLSLELDSPSVMLEEEKGGGVSIARAFAPARPSAPREEAQGGSRWTVYVSRLAIRQGDVWWVDARRDTRLQASGVDLEARGLWAPDRARIELRLGGSIDEPVSGPVKLELAGGLDGTAVRVPVLRASLGKTSVALVGEGDLARRTGRVAALKVDVSRDLARAVDAKLPPGGDLDATGYAESDGTTLTAALRAEPGGAGGGGGRADAAVAARVGAPTRAVGFDVALDRLDPARLAAELPRGEITLAAHGAAAGRTLKELRGRLDARLARSRLRGGEIQRAEVVARADRGAVEISRAALVAPGVTAEGAGRWRAGGALGGRAAVDATDLSALSRNVAALLGRKPAAVAGRARIDVTAGGTEDAPTGSATVDAPTVRFGGVALSAVRLGLEGAGPVRTITARVEGRVGSVWSGGADVARAVTLRGALAQGSGSVDATATLPGFEEPARIEGRGKLSPELDTLALSTLAVSYPGSRWSLTAPAQVTLAGPSVDRLELAEHDQRLALAGGLDADGVLDARASLVRVDLARLPPGLLAPGAARVRGEVSADVRATGPSRARELAATFTLGGGAVRDLAGIAAVGSASWSGASRRATGSLSITRDDATADLAVDLPVPLAGRPGERIRATVRASALPLRELLEVAGSDADARGTIAVDAALEGTVATPALHATARLSGGSFRELEGVAVELGAEDGGERLALSARASLQDAVASARAEVPLDLADLLLRPAATLRAARAAPVTGSAAVTGLELAAISGRAGVPPGLGGRLEASATVTGTLARPRADVAADLSQGSFAGYRGVGAHVAVALGAASSSASGRVVLAGEEALRFGVTLAAPPEKLATAAALRAAPLTAEAVVAKLALERSGPKELPLTGTVSARLTVAGTPGAPDATLRVEGGAVAIEGRPLGKLLLDASYAKARTTGALRIAPPTGGELRATATVHADLGLGARRTPLGEAPTEATVTADAVDLSVAAALVPRRIRSAGGTLTAELALRGPLARLSPRGTVTVRDGQVAVTEYGEFTGIALAGRATEDALEVTQLEVHRGKGKATATAALRGLSGGKARLQAHLDVAGFMISRAGMPVATFDLKADATGGLEKRTLSTDVTVAHGVVHVPKRQPRPLQSIDERKDIVVGRPEASAARGDRGAGEPGLALVVHVLVPRNFFLKGEDPRMDIELKADATYEASGGDDYMRGYVETVRGTIEPIAGRTFTIDRARVQFTGGPPSAATLDVEAKYTNPAAVVSAKIVGPLDHPDITLSSQPPMDEAQIALLIATGQRDLKAGTASVGTLSGSEAGKVALGAVATTAFRELVANKLPIDTFSLDSGSLRAGKYVTDKIYFGYVRRFEADPARGENPDEVRIEYQITPRWNFESRYGTAQAGGASLIWSKDF